MAVPVGRRKRVKERLVSGGFVQHNPLFSHAGVFQDVHVDQQGLLVFSHPAQKQRALLQQASGRKSKVSDSSATLQLREMEILGSRTPHHQRESR